MNKSFYVGAIGAAQTTKRLSVIANNLANVNNTGFKPKKVAFSELIEYNIKEPEEAVTNLQAGAGTKVARTYKAGGSVAFAALPTPDEAHLGFVYNVTDKFTTTAGFIEGAGSKHPAGTNVAIVAVTDGEATGYKYDVMAGFVDLSGLQPKEDGKGLSANDYTTEDKTKLGGIAEGATKVEASDTEGAIKVNGTDLQVVTIATDAEVTEMLNEVFGTAEA